ncbi:hypothetical protein Terro_3692 [Terriglobus roseus DSM 18391]|uniref:Uncharacterized protein n=1 Tax=Terriglobus roseus (strain DSM 18391 / NRRL B-41598 / KBS 63) TaxID=926566 RepID=I3ZKY5_TERRK|nr:hypothetical protein [Terriglobus roseus]AFL89903.1 hypothetical protein Terro_3692 [Terriglobus roseus DSM 18391]
MTEARTSSPALIAGAWLLVALPLAWGVYKTGLNAAKLFTSPPAAAAPATPGVK